MHATKCVGRPDHSPKAKVIIEVIMEQVGETSGDKMPFFPRNTLQYELRGEIGIQEGYKTGERAG